MIFNKDSKAFPSIGTDLVPSLKTKRLPPFTVIGMQDRFSIISCAENKEEITKLEEKMLKEFEEFRILLHKRWSGTQD